MNFFRHTHQRTRIIAAVAAEGRTLLTEYESKKVLAAYGIPITDTELAQTPDEAVAAAARLARPGDAVLLSPACSSFDMFKSYQERGDAFAVAVRAMWEESP